VPFALPDFVCHAKDFLGTLCTSKQQPSSSAKTTSLVSTTKLPKLAEQEELRASGPMSASWTTRQVASLMFDGRKVGAKR